MRSLQTRVPPPRSWCCVTARPGPRSSWSAGTKTRRSWAVRTCFPGAGRRRGRRCGRGLVRRRRARRDASSTASSNPRRSPITWPPHASCSKKPACCSPDVRTATFVSLAGAADHERLKQDRAAGARGQTTLRAVIEREQLRLALDALVLFAHWVTPPVDTRQFDTRFFMTRVPAHQTPAHDDTETTHSLWARPAMRSPSQ